MGGAGGEGLDDVHAAFLHEAVHLTTHINAIHGIDAANKSTVEAVDAICLRALHTVTNGI